MCSGLMISHIPLVEELLLSQKLIIIIIFVFKTFCSRMTHIMHRIRHNIPWNIQIIKNSS